MSTLNSDIRDVYRIVKRGFILLPYDMGFDWLLEVEISLP